MIIVYTKPDCSQCRFAKRFLTEKELPFKAIDITQDDEAFQHVKDLGFLSLPVIESDDLEPFSGFDLGKLIKLYHLNEGRK